METLELIEGETGKVRKQKHDFPLKGRQLTMEELDARLNLAKTLGLTNPNEKFIVVVDTETGEIVI